MGACPDGHLLLQAAHAALRVGLKGGEVRLFQAGGRSTEKRGFSFTHNGLKSPNRLGSFFRALSLLGCYGPVAGGLQVLTLLA